MIDKATYKLTTVITKEIFDFIILLLREQYGIDNEVSYNWHTETITIHVPHYEIIDLVDREGNLLSDVKLLTK